MRRTSLPAPQRKEFARMVEAWVYAIILLLAAVACQMHGQWWPMWPVLGLIGLLAGLRLR